MTEWSNVAVSKTVEPYGFPGFESLSLRHKSRIPTGSFFCGGLALVNGPSFDHKRTLSKIKNARAGAGSAATQSRTARETGFILQR